MRGLVAMAGACAVFGIVAVPPTASHAAAANDLAAENNLMPAAGAADPMIWQIAQHRRHHRRGVRPGYQNAEPYGCYRWGEYGYRWYPFCVGPSFLYPHQRVCRGGYCWYR